MWAKNRGIYGVETACFLAIFLSGCNTLQINPLRYNTIKPLQARQGEFRAEAPGASSSTVASEANTLTTKSHSSSREEKLLRMQVTGGYLADYHDLLFYRGAMTAEELLSAS